MIGPKIKTENEELFTVRDAMREMNRLVDRLEAGSLEKVVMTRSGQMVAVVLPLEAYAALVNGGAP